MGGFNVVSELQVKPGFGPLSREKKEIIDNESINAAEEFIKNIKRGKKNPPMLNQLIFFRILKKYDSIRILIFISTMLSVIGIIFLICIFMNFLPLALVLILTAFYWFFLGFIPSNTGALALYPFSGNIGRASALMGSIIMLAGALASAMASYLHDGTSHPMFFVMSACAFVSLALFITGVQFISDKNII